MMVIQKALASDAESLRMAAISAFLDDQRYKPAYAISGGPPGHDTVESHAHWIRNYDYFKCIVHGIIVGGCIVKMHPSHYELFGIFLHSNFIGKGIGSEFLRGVIKLYPNGVHWTLETPDYAKRNHRFYERNGFIASEKSTPDPRLGFGFIIYQRPAQPGTTADSQGRGIFGSKR
jgi:GNAT superfamily N-acetyltransferase